MTEAAEIRVYEHTDEQAVIGFYQAMGFQVEEHISTGKRLYS